jgi:hypothetical protein
MNGYVGLYPRRNQKPETSELNGAVQVLKRENVGRVVGLVARTVNQTNLEALQKCSERQIGSILLSFLFL